MEGINDVYIDEENIVRRKLRVEISQEKNLYNFFEEKFKNYGEAVALHDTDTDLKCTYKDFVKYPTRIAAFLQSKGLRDGDIIAMNVRNCHNFFYPIFGALKQSLGVATYNEYATSFEANHILTETNAKVLFINCDQLAKSREAIKGTNVELIVSLERCDADDVYFYDDILNSSEFDVDVSPESPQSDVAFIYFSSGSTGPPKGVVITKGNVLTMIAQATMTLSSLKGANVLVTTILAHMSALVAILFPLFVQATIYLCNDGMHDEEKTISVVQKHKIHMLLVLSPFCSFLANSPIVDKYDISSLKIILFGGSTVPVHVIEKMIQRFPDIPVQQAYGMTETTGTGIAQQMDVKLRKVGSTGIPTFNMDVKIVDQETKKAVGVNKRGEIWLRGPNIFKEYLNNPEATARDKTPDGWLKTGDIGYFDDQFNFFIVDRIKEIIKLKDGVPLYPGQVEQVLQNHAAILECCVVGKPMDGGSYELPVGFVVQKPGVEVTESELYAMLAEKLSAYKSLTGGIKFVDKLPRLANGKISKVQLRKQLQNEEFREE